MVKSCSQHCTTRRNGMPHGQEASIGIHTTGIQRKSVHIEQCLRRKRLHELNAGWLTMFRYQAI
jgi:hypothetical protein